MSVNGHGALADRSQARDEGEEPGSNPDISQAKTLRDRIGKELPFLRRYARALTGSQESGDAYVRATLEAGLSSPELLARMAQGRVELYEAFSGIWNTAHVEQQGHPHHNLVPMEQQVQDRLSEISSIQRQALLLTQLEEFTMAEAGQVLGLSPQEAEFLVEQAVADIEHDAATEVLIIEDEPLISSHIEAIVEELGHRVVAVAATADQASAAYARHRPGLVLADIQLADGSSGLTAVDEILAMGPVPVIFITAFPEKLLTGARPEPSFLVAKPFREETVRATISQALFFGSRCSDAASA